jgi:hypothetical protein
MSHKIKGELTLTFRDAETLEVLREVDTENLFTLLGSKFLLTPGFTISTGGQAPAVHTMQDATQGYALIGISSSKPVASRAYSDIKSVYGKGSVLAALTWNNGTPPYIEIKGRFTAPATARTINTIYIGSNSLVSTSYWQGSATNVAVLTSPCSQATTEVLDITYRIQLIEQAYTGTDANIIKSSDVLGYYALYSYASSSMYGVPMYIDTSWSKSPPNTVPYRTLAGSMGQITDYTRTVNQYRFRMNWTKNYAVTDRVGAVMSSVQFTGCQINGVPLKWPSTGTTTWVNSLNYLSTAWAPMTTSTFTNKPIQVIHNHNANAVAPFLDVSFLATSQGSINVSASSWDQTGYPEFDRVEYMTTGAVGSAKYMFRRRIMLGFNESNTYAPNIGTYNQFMYANEGTPTDNSIPTYKGFTSKVSNIEQYDNKRVVLFEATGISILQLITGDVVTFHATTSPALPVTNVGQVAVDTLGNIWVGCRNTGLYKISNPLTSPTITKMSVSTNGIPADTGCFGVALGYAGRVWAMFDGGLSATLNNGTSWINYNPGSTPVFSYTGITNSNWNVVRMLRVDINSVDNQMAVVVNPPVATNAIYNAIIWWSLTTTTLFGPQAAAGLGITTPLYGQIRCSKFNSAWMLTTQNSSNMGSYVCVFNSVTTTLLSSAGRNSYVPGSRHQVTFSYDYYGVPYCISTSGSTVDISNLENTTYGLLYNGFAMTSWLNETTTGGNGSGAVFATEMYPSANPVVLTRGYNQVGYTPINSYSALTAAVPILMNQFAPTSYVDPLNGRYSPFEEMAWEKYHWNGSAWQLNYYAPAIDTSSYTHDAIRHNFDTENHTFTGRSMVDVSSLFVSGAFTSNATFAFYINPVAKLTTSNKQEPIRTLLAIEDTTSIFRVYWDNGAGSIVVVHGAVGLAAGTSTTVTTTPANGSAYRVVITVAGTTCKIYSNGVQLGTNVTLSNTPNWANTTGNLKAYIGAKVYARLQTINSPWPSYFFKGSLTNAQFWNVTWNGTDISNDAAAPTGVISSQSATNLRGRYELTQSLAGLETKTTHSTYQVLPNGTQIKFNDGVSGNSCVAGDYYTYGVCDGILKDNANSFTDTHSLYYKPINASFAEFLNVGGTNTISATSSPVTERIRPLLNVFVDWIDGDVARHSRSVTESQTGMVEFGSATPTTANSGFVAVQGITANGGITFSTFTASENQVHVGLSTDSSSGAGTVNIINYGFFFTAAGTFNIIQLATTMVSGIAYTETDTFEVRRTGTTVTYYKNGSLLYTSLVASSGNLYARIAMSPGGFDGSSGVRNCNITYDLPSYFMQIGNSTTLTGKFSPDFIAVEDGIPTTVNITLNGGSPITVTTTTVAMHLIPTPIAGTAYLNGNAGWLKFNPADVGAVVGGYVTVIYDKF